MSTVVIVDDSQIELEMFTKALIEAGHDCVGVAEPSIALSVIKDTNPDFIILDYSMPHKNGIELCKDLKLNPLTRDIPVMFLTSDSDPDHIIATIHLGCIDYIRKPITTDEFVSLVMKHDIAKGFRDVLEPLKKDAERIMQRYDRRGGRHVE